ncbi:MAG: hypothetical protein IKY71_00760 [Bacteroidaceae bacterium]|nr:hypothetical protein [Bacteroidaceae bacterium]
MTQFAFLFAPGHGIIWLILVLLVIAIYKWKTVLLGLFYILILPLVFPIAIISAVFKWEPKFIRKWERNVEEYRKKNQ